MTFAPSESPLPLVDFFYYLGNVFSACVLDIADDLADVSCDTEDDDFKRLTDCSISFNSVQAMLWCLLW